MRKRTTTWLALLAALMLLMVLPSAMLAADADTPDADTPAETSGDVLSGQSRFNQDGTSSHMLQLKSDCSVSFTCNGDGTINLSAQNCTTEQLDRLFELIKDVC